MNPQHYALVVGINRYPDLDHLKLAIKDAEDFSEWLLDPEKGGLAEKQVRKIIVPDCKMPDGTPREEARPVQKQVHQGLYELHQACGKHIEEHPEDWEQTRLYVYLSGHGLSWKFNDAALLMADAGPDWYGENFPCEKFIDFYNEAQFFKEIVFLADCCRYRVDNVPPSGPPWTKVKKNNGKVLTFAGYATYFGDPAFEPSGDELSAEAADGDARRSYFTRALIEGLDGSAVDPMTGRVDSNSLALYLQERVLELTGEKQKPQVLTDPSEPIIFREGLDPVGLHRVEIKIKSEYAGSVELLNAEFEILEKHGSVPQPWEIELRDGLYLVRPEQEANPFANGGMFSVYGGETYVEL